MGAASPSRGRLAHTLWRLLPRATVLGALAGLCGLAAGCGAATPSQELVSARASYEAATEGAAPELVPDKLLTARQALDTAERAFDEEENSAKARNLAYIAHRKALIAIAEAGIATSARLIDSAEREYQEVLEKVAKKQKATLGETQAELERQERELQAKQKQLSDEQKKLKQRETELAKERAAREEVEARLAAAIKSLEEVARVQEDARGTIITLSGAVLFKTGEATLLPLAERQLAKVADALNAYDEGRTIVVAGHTDSRGSSSANTRLSLSRAESVRTFLVSQGVKTSRIRAVGRGEDEPIADNRTADGRANNRRVEIIVEGASR